jgi:hypothetical protein
MHIRIFGDEGWYAAVAFLVRSDTSLKVDTPNVGQWLSGANIPKADLHIYAGVPQRLALKDAHYNVAVVCEDKATQWCVADYSEPLLKNPATVRERIAELRGVLGRVRKALKPKKESDEKPAIATTATSATSALPETPLVGVVILTTAARFSRWNPNIKENIQRQKWPKDKTRIFLVSDAQPDRQSAMMELLPAGVELVSSPLMTPFGTKRNMGGAAAAAAGCDVLAMMDDDDNYPENSILTRVTALRTSAKPIVFCSAIPLYDALRYSSAVSVPPLMDPPHLRSSEASMAFTVAAWRERKFPDDSKMAEGAGFLEGRIAQTAEMHPIGVIVSIIHGANISSRRVPEMKEPNGCHWGFQPDYFQWLSKIAIEQVQQMQQLQQHLAAMKQKQALPDQNVTDISQEITVLG